MIMWLTEIGHERRNEMKFYEVRSQATSATFPCGQVIGTYTIKSVAESLAQEQFEKFGKRYDVIERN